MQEQKIYKKLKFADCLYSEIDVDMENPEATYTTSSMHSHNYNELCIITQGNTKIITPKSIQHQKGCFLIFYPAFIPHMQINSLSSPYKRYLVRFETSIANPSLLSPNAKQFVTGASDVLSLPIDEQNIETLLNAVILLKSLCKSREDSDNLYSKNLTLAVILNIISQFIASHDSHTMPVGKYFYIGEILSYISDNFHTKLTADELARVFYVSRAKLMNDFKRITGETLANYITKVRLEHAAALILSGESLSNISEKCGFSSVSYFISCFGKAYGITPSKYKARGLTPLPQSHNS